MSHKHLHRYANELTHRLNSGTGNNFDVIGDTTLGMEGRQLTWKQLNRGTEDGNISVDDAIAPAPPSSPGILAFDRIPLPNSSHNVHKFALYYWLFLSAHQRRNKHNRRTALRPPDHF